MSRDYIAENDKSRAELGALIGRLGAQDFQVAVGAGWTVSTQLCHLVFWDRRMLTLVRAWKAGAFEAALLSAQSTDAINGAVKEISRAVPGPAAAKLALESAAAIDAEVAGIGDELLGQIEAEGLTWVTRRHLHRREHVEQINSALQAGRQKSN